MKSYDSLVDTINSMGYNVSSDIETFIIDELKRLRECKEKHEWLVRKIEEEEEDDAGNKLIGVVVPVRM